MVVHKVTFLHKGHGLLKAEVPVVGEDEGHHDGASPAVACTGVDQDLLAAVAHGSQPVHRLAYHPFPAQMCGIERVKVSKLYHKR